MQTNKAGEERILETKTSKSFLGKVQMLYSWSLLKFLRNLNA